MAFLALKSPCFGMWRRVDRDDTAELSRSRRWVDSVSQAAVPVFFTHQLQPMCKKDIEKIRDATWRNNRPLEAEPL